MAASYGKAVFSVLTKFDACAWSYEVCAIKPDPLIYQHIVDSLECRAEEVLFIGDITLADVAGPAAFGMSAKLINRKGGQMLKVILNDLIS